MELVLGLTKRNRNGHFGNALLTSYPVKDVRRIDLSVFGRQPRGALDVDLLIKGETVRVIVAHLGLGLRERRKQIRRLLDIFCSTRDRMEIMLGDFNEWVPLGNPLWYVHDVFGKSPPLRTFPVLHARFAARQDLGAADGISGVHVETHNAAESKGIRPFARQGSCNPGERETEDRGWKAEGGRRKRPGGKRRFVMKGSRKRGAGS